MPNPPPPQGQGSLRDPYAWRLTPSRPKRASITAQNSPAFLSSISPIALKCAFLPQLAPKGSWVLHFQPERLPPFTSPSCLYLTLRAAEPQMRPAVANINCDPRLPRSRSRPLSFTACRALTLLIPSNRHPSLVPSSCTPLHIPPGWRPTRPKRV